MRSALFILSLLFFYSCQQSPQGQQSNSDNPANGETTTVDSTDSSSSEGDTLSSTPEANPSENSPTGGTLPPANVAVLCNDNSFDLEAAVNNAAQQLSGTPYSQENKTDCSGMFHKAINTIRAVCPDAGLPTIEEARSSRDIAGWYHKNGDFLIVRDPAQSQDLIQPGAVMFFGYGSRLGQYNFQSMTIDTLMTRNVGINHVAIVTSVKRVDGVVESYEMFHGRSPGKPASVTSSSRVYANHPDLPTYGNWKEPWLGVANMLAKK